MKKIVFIFLLFSMSSYSFKYIALEPKVGAQVYFSNDTDQLKLRNSINYLLETYYKMDKFELGLGIGYSRVEVQEKNGIVTSYDTLSRLPVYLVGRSYLMKLNGVEGYFKGQVGINFILNTPMEKLENSRFYAFGFGLDMNNYTAEILLNVENHLGDSDYYNGSIAYEFTVGYKF